MPDIQELLRLKDAYRGRKGFILATGPSLAYKDLSFLKDEVTIALNLAPLMCDQWGFRPTFHMVGDRYVYPLFSQVFEQLTKNTDITKIVVAAACETFPAHLTDANTYFSRQMLPQGNVRFSKNPLEEGFWRGKTVTYYALQFAYFLGFAEVYILGMDMTVNHDWGTDAHCYELRRNPRFPDLEFPHIQTHFIQRGLPGNPHFWGIIKEFLVEARTAFEAVGRKLINDTRSTMDALDQEDIIRKFSDNPHVVAFLTVKDTGPGAQCNCMRQLDGKPIFLHVLDTLVSCHAVDEVYLDTESENAAKLAKERMGKKIQRVPGASTNATDPHQMLLSEASQVLDGDIYIQVLPTAPFLRRSTIDTAVYTLAQSPQHTSVISVVEQQCLSKKEQAQNCYSSDLPNTRNRAPATNESMSLYAVRRRELFASTATTGRNPIFFPISPLEVFDIKTEEDLQIAEAALKKLQR